MRSDGSAVAVLEGHRDQVGRPVRLGPPRLDHGLHPDIDSPALERLHQIVQVIDFPFREDDEHLPSPFHHLDGVAFRLLVLAAALHGESPEALEPPAGDPVALVERLAVHHEEEPAAAAAGQFQAGLEVRLIGVVGGEDDARPLREIPQHLRSRRSKTEPVAPGQVESEESLDGPDAPIPRAWPVENSGSPTWLPLARPPDFPDADGGLIQIGSLFTVPRAVLRPPFISRGHAPTTR